MSAELPKMQYEAILELAKKHNLGTVLKPIGGNAARVIHFDSGYRTAELIDFARAIEQEAARQAMERCAALCDAKYLVRHAQGFPREASTARNLRDAIRAITNESEKRHG